MAEKIYHYPVWVRLWHTLNALFCLVLIVSGISMQYAAPGRMLVPLETAVKMHNFSGILLSLNYLIFFLGNFFSPNINNYKLNEKPFLGNLTKQFHYYTYGIFRGDKKPFPVSKERKFNPLQKITYSITMYIFVPMVIISGIIMLNPSLIEETKVYLTVDIIHIMAGFLISFFLLIHLYFSTIGAKGNYRAISTGWHEEEE